MFKPYDMSRVIVTGPKKVQEAVIKEFHKLKVLHIVEHTQDDLADIGEPLESANKLSEAIVKVRALITALNIQKEETELKLDMSSIDIDKTTKKLNDEVNVLFEELRNADELISKSETLKKELEILKNIDVPLESFQGYRSLAIFTGYIGKNISMTKLRKEISKITHKSMLLEDDVKKRKFIVLFVDIKSRENIINLLKPANFSPVKFINMGNLKGNAKHNLERVEAESKKNERLTAQIMGQIEKLSRGFKDFLINAEEFLSQELEKAEAPLKFAATKDVFLIKGWVPTEQLNNVMQRLNKVGKNAIYIDHEPAKDKDNVPVKLKNQKYAKPFEFFIDMYSIPKYKEIDPTFFMFLTYPLFFGFMLGDVGYGIVSFALFYWLKKKIPKGAMLLNVLMLSSFVSIVFGLIYGEFFGLEEIGHFAIPHLISRTQGITEMMYISIGIGVVHVNWGLIAGFINVKKIHGLKHAIFEKGSWFVLQVGIALLALSILEVIKLPSLVGAVFLIISIIMLYKGEGVKGLIELPSILTNTLSYLRLMAIGLSSVSIAVVVNEMAAGFFHEGGFMILSGILILLVGHVLNIVIGLFGSFLHSLRLHYVEFFSKFYEGGAEKYKPFGEKQ